MIFNSDKNHLPSPISAAAAVEAVVQSQIRPYLFLQQKLNNKSMKSFVRTSNLNEHKQIPNKVKNKPDSDDKEDEEQICGWSKGETLAERFCLDSSLHGLKYIGQSRRSYCEKYKKE